MRKIFDRHLHWILAGLGILLLLGIVAQVIVSMPPRRFTFLTGREDGAYYIDTQLYQQVAARHGFTIDMIQTAGSVEALRMLEEGQGDVAFIQGGIAAEADLEKVSALATLAYEPVWIFYRRELAPSEPLDSPLQLQGMRIAIGEPGSGTNPLARLLLEDFGVTDENTTLLELSSADAVDALQASKIDATFLVAAVIAPVLIEMIEDRNLELMSLRDVDALARRHRFLSVVNLPKGTLDLVDVIPRHDVELISTEINLMVRNKLHPDLLRLLAFAAVEIHGPGGFFSAPNAHPSTENTDIPVSQEGKVYLQRIKNGEFSLDRYLPFWAAAMFDRYLLFVLPLLLIVLPLLARSPVLYQVYMRRKVNRWYKDIHQIELHADTLGLSEIDAAIAELERIDDGLMHELSISEEYMPNLYALRLHTDYVVGRLQKRKSTMEAAMTTPAAT